MDFSGKRGVILGIGNQRSIAWTIGEQLHQLKAELALTYLEDPKGRFEAKVRQLAEETKTSVVLACNVENDSDLDRLVDALGEQWGKLDFLVHSLAYADHADLSRPFSATSRQGFAKAMDVSAYSLITLCGKLAPLMTEGGSMVTLTYLGSERAIPNYNVMGPAKAALESSVRYLAAELGSQNIRVNAVSAGAIRTLSASGVKDFAKMLEHSAERSPLKRSVTLEEVAHTAAFLCHPMSSGITGQVIYVDCGYSIMGL